MAKNPVMHSLYLLIILALVALVLWPVNLSDSVSLPAASSESASGMERSQDARTPAEPLTADTQSAEATQALQQLVAERDATITELEARILRLEESLAAAQRRNGETSQPQAPTLTDDEYHQLARARRDAEEAQRDQAFANAQPTSASDQAQRSIENSFYSIDNIPRFEDLTIECREVYCNIEVTFEDPEVAREFLSYYSRRVFDHADIRTSMTRAESRGNVVIIKADLAPPLEE